MDAQNNASPSVSTPSELSGAPVPESVKSGQLALERFKSEVKAVVNNDSLKRLDRLPILRQIKDDLKLRLQDSEIRKMMHDARRKGRPAYEPISSGRKLRRVKTKWLLDGIVMAGQVNIVLALAKTGKTLLVLQFIAALVNGEESFLGRKLSQGDRNNHILICGPDMNEADWAECLDTSGLLVEDELIGDGRIELLTAEDAFNLDDDGIDFIAHRAQQYPSLVVLLDSYTKSMEGMGYQDKDTSYGDPLSALADAVAPWGATVIVIHHVSKTNRNASPVLAGRGSMRMTEIASWVVKIQFVEQESINSSSDNLVSGPRRITTTGRGRSVELIAEMDANGCWSSSADIERVLLRIEEEQHLANLLNSLNDRQKTALEILKCEWADGETSTVEMVAARLFGGPPTEDSKRKARSTLDQLKDKGLIEKALITEDYGQCTVFWPTGPVDGPEAVEHQSERSSLNIADCLF
ncbi:AAA family ATPase [Synechococcus sp. CB0205]|uniref:AAA family ATPase n=1 Tax=Synechococcus sp. CB0205 TaxID=232363 RepID=UPI0003002EF2|nr:AAA family ATPase [Synechococcus sp. CB0205]